MDKFKNKYRIPSNRKPNWDYSANGHYFLTIITQNRICNLGDIVNEEIILSDFGKIVEIEWFKSFEIRDELILHEFIMMPNHLHTIVEIYNDKIGAGDSPIIDSPIIDPPAVDPPDGHTPAVDTYGRTYLQNNSDIQIKRNPPIRLPKSISSFIGGFKSVVNTKIDDYIDEHQLPIPKYNRNNHFFQPNYHDHIIRNNDEYQRIKFYIRYNPKNWKKDKLKG